MVKQRRRPRLPKIESLAFLEPTDRLERRGGQLYVMDSKGIYGAIGNSSMALSKVVSRTGYPREEVATWLLEMERNGLISHSIELPNDKAEAVFSLSPKARPLLHRLA